jgi:biopolymer transport protein ExbD
MITRPLDLESRLSPPPRDFTALAWVNAGMIALFFSLLGSRFVLAPGMLVELPAVDPAAAGAEATAAVVTYRRDNILLFQDGGMYSLPELQKRLELYARAHPGAALLVRADRQVSQQALIELGIMAKAAGFTKMIWAGDVAVPDRRLN